MRENQPTESPLPEHEDVVRTKGETSPLFYLLLMAALFLLPWGIILLIGSSGRVWAGLDAVALGALALGYAVWILSLKVLISSKGLVFRRWWQRREIGWDEIQIIRLSVVGGKSGADGGLVIVGGSGRGFHFIADPRDYVALKGYLAMRCANAVIMDADAEVVRPPVNGDDESRDALARKAGREMVRWRAISNVAIILIVVGYWAAASRHQPDARSMWLITAVCATLVGSLGFDVYRIAKRLWR